jgi:hypothetical protein
MVSGADDKRIISWASPYCPIAQYGISNGRYLVLFISDPKQPYEEEVEMKQIHSMDKSFFQFTRYPEEDIVSEDFIAVDIGATK